MLTEYFTNLKVYEETNDKNVYKCMWRRYQVTFNVKHEHYRCYNACFSSTVKNVCNFLQYSKHYIIIYSHTNWVVTSQLMWVSILLVITFQ